MPVSEASDRARAIRYLQPYMMIDGDILLLGNFGAQMLMNGRQKGILFPE
jgi:hypothetical protein